METTSANLAYRRRIFNGRRLAERIAFRGSVAHCRDRCDQFFVLTGKDGSQVEEEAVILNAAYDCLRGDAQPPGKFLRAPMLGFHRHRPAR